MGEGFFSKLKVLIGIEEIEDEDVGEDFLPPKQDRKPAEVRSVYSTQRAEAKEIKDKDSRVLSMASRSTSPNHFKMVVIEPRAFDECPKLVDSLKSKKPVIINLEKIESDTARKIFDFLSGATYALDGNVQKVANNIFVFVPENVDVAAYVGERAPGGGDGIKNPWR